MTRRVAAIVVALFASVGFAQENAKTIESTGKILGVGIGMSLAEAQRKLEPLADGRSVPRKGRDKDGLRQMWRFKETEYLWLMVWAKDEKIVAVDTAVRREKPKRFDEIGDLKKAAVNTDARAVWNIDDERRGKFRLVAKGSSRRALNISMFSLDEAEID